MWLLKNASVAAYVALLQFPLHTWTIQSHQGKHIAYVHHKWEFWLQKNSKKTRNFTTHCLMCTMGYKSIFFCVVPQSIVCTRVWYTYGEIFAPIYTNQLKTTNPRLLANFGFQKIPCIEGRLRISLRLHLPKRV